MADLPLRAELFQDFINIAALIFLIILSRKRVHQEEIKIVHPADLQLLQELGPHILLGIEERRGHFIRQEEAFPRIP